MRKAFFYWRQNPGSITCGVQYDSPPSKSLEDVKILQVHEITDDPELFNQEREEPNFGALQRRFPKPTQYPGRARLAPAKHSRDGEGLGASAGSPADGKAEPPAGEEAKPRDPDIFEIWFEPFPDRPAPAG